MNKRNSLVGHLGWDRMGLLYDEFKMCRLPFPKLMVGRQQAVLSDADYTRKY